MNTASWIILGILILIVGIVIAFLIKNKGSKCSCCKSSTCPKCKKNKESGDI